MGKIEESTLKPCSRCAKCCITHPCALAPNDLGKIADHLGLCEGELFTRFLVLDYIDSASEKHYFVCPARKNDQPGVIVKSDWTFSDSPCVFLEGNECSIEEVKPEGGRRFYCGMMTTSNRNFIGYGKKEAAHDWGGTHLLRRLVVLTKYVDGCEF